MIKDEIMVVVVKKFGRWVFMLCCVGASAAFAAPVTILNPAMTVHTNSGMGTVFNLATDPLGNGLYNGTMNAGNTETYFHTPCYFGGWQSGAVGTWYGGAASCFNYPGPGLGVGPYCYVAPNHKLFQQVGTIQAGRYTLTAKVGFRLDYTGSPFFGLTANRPIDSNVILLNEGANDRRLDQLSSMPWTQHSGWQNWSIVYQFAPYSPLIGKPLYILLGCGTGAVEAQYDDVALDYNSAGYNGNDEENPLPVLDGRHWGMYGGSVVYDVDFGVVSMPLNGWAATDIFNSDPNTQAWWNSVHAARLAGRYLLPVFTTSGTITERKAQLALALGRGNVSEYPKDLVGIALREETTAEQDIEENELYDYIKTLQPNLKVYKWYSYPTMPYSFYLGVAEKADGYIRGDYATKDPNVFRKVIMKHLVTGKPLIVCIWASEPGWSGPTGPFNEDLIPGVASYNQNGLILNKPNSSLEKYYRMTSGTLREFGMPVCNFGVAGSGSVSLWWQRNASPNLGYIVNELALPLQFAMRTSSGQKAITAEFSDSNGTLVGVSGAYTYTDGFNSPDWNIGLKTIDDASIRFFSNLLQTNDLTGVLATRDYNGSGYVELIYRFYSNTGSLSSASANLVCKAVAAQGGVNVLGLSKNGQDITTSVQSAGTGSDETLTISGGAAYADLKAFYVHIKMQYNSSPSGSPANFIKILNVTASRNPSETPTPEPAKCSGPFDAADISGPDRYNLPDCRVNLYDFVLLAQEWMKCTNPAVAACQ